MNFFESQDTAKRNTTKLIVLFVLAVLSLILITNVLVMFLLGYASTGMTSMAATWEFRFDWNIFLSIGAIVTAVVLFGSLYKISSLSGGGARIAESMNAKLILPGSDDLNERRVLNVVEEMAIAAGTPVPPVYLMEEAGINAFAAGYSPSDAVIGITRGTIETLTRDQLQGVIAHEFSHILHGDMRINIRLIGVLHGIMVLGLIGYHLMRSGAHSRRSKDSGGVVMLGLGLTVIGFVGVFFGNLIKAAVSRQREFLADASAVQFTRNPEGISGALMQIAQHDSRSYLNNPKSEEISHALFEEGKRSVLSSLYATHPPLEKRIKAILPNWDGNFAAVNRPIDSAAEVKSDSAQKAAAQREKSLGILAGAAGVLITNSMINQVGNPEAKHLQHAEGLLRDMPAMLHAAAQHPSSARALVYLLILDSSEPLRMQQLELLQKQADEGVYKELQTLIQNHSSIEAEFRLPLATIAMSSLRQLSMQQYQLFKRNFNALIVLDRKINLFEWALQKIVFHNLDAVFDQKGLSKTGRRDLKNCEESTGVLLSIIAHSNPQQNIAADMAFAAGAEKLNLDKTMLALTDINFDSLNDAMEQLAELKPLQKPALLKACAACITADGKIAPIEAELLRAIAASIDCPMPPLVV